MRRHLFAWMSDPVAVYFTVTGHGPPAGRLHDASPEPLPLTTKPITLTVYLFNFILPLASSSAYALKDPLN